MNSRSKLGVVTALAAVAACFLFVVPAQASWLSQILFGTNVQYRSPGITATVEQWLPADRLTRSEDPARFLGFWAVKNDNPQVQSGSQESSGGVVATRGTVLRVKVAIEPGTQNLGDRLASVQMYGAGRQTRYPSVTDKNWDKRYPAYNPDDGMLSLLPPSHRMYQEFLADTADLDTGTTMFRIFVSDAKKAPAAYLGVGIVVVPTPEDMKRQAEILAGIGMDGQLRKQEPVKTEPIAGNGSGYTTPDPEPASPPTGSVVITTNCPVDIRILSDDKEVVTKSVQDRRVFDNVPVGKISIKMRSGGYVWEVNKLSQKLESGGRVEFALKRVRRSAR